MSELAEGQTVEVRGSAARPYQLKHLNGVYSCSCPAWRDQSRPIDVRTCKHLRQYRGEAAEAARIGGLLPATTVAPAKSTSPQIASSFAGRSNWASPTLTSRRARV